MGNRVYSVDINNSKIEDLKNNIVPIFEPGLKDLVTRNSKHGDLVFTTNLNEGLEKF